MQHGVEVEPYVEAFANDGNQQIGRDSDPDLSFDRVFRRAVKSFDTKVLFDPLEEQLDLPATPIKVGNGARSQAEVVGDEHEALGALGIPIANAAKMSGMSLQRVEPGQRDGLVALHAAVLVDKMGDQFGGSGSFCGPA